MYKEVIDVAKGIKTCEVSECKTDAKFKIRKIVKKRLSVKYLCLKHYKLERLI